MPVGQHKHRANRPRAALIDAPRSFRSPDAQRLPTPSRAIQSPVDRARYDRQILLDQIGHDGQQRLSRGSVLLIGCGALGCVSGDLLARAGVGTLTIVDRDLVEPSNLQRQSLYTEADADGLTPKAHAAAARLRAVNSGVRIEPIVADVTSATIGRIADEASPDVIVDGTDNFQTRLLLNDLAVERGLPLVYGGVVGMRGTMLVVRPQVGPCLACLLGGMPADSGGTCDTVGVFGPAVYQVAAWQAGQAIKLLTGAEPESSLIEIDSWTGLHRSLAFPRDPACPVCVGRRFESLRGDAPGSAELCGQDAVQVHPGRAVSLDLDAICETLARAGTVERRPGLARVTLGSVGDDGMPASITVFRDGRAIIKGVRSGPRGRALYDRYIGG